jgi:hypothetical protein
VLLLETARTLTFNSQDHRNIAHSFATDGFAPFKSESISRGSRLFSTTISLRSNASERTTFSVLELLLVQKCHGTRTPSSIHSCVSCSSSPSACLHVMPYRKAFLPSTLALATFPLLPGSCTRKGTMACPCARSSVFASRTRETRRSMCRCPAAIISR